MSAFVDALERGDALAAASFYAEDGRLLAPSAELIAGRSEIEAYWRAGIALGLSSARLHAVDLQIRGGTAIEIGHYVLGLSTGGGPPVADRGKYLVLHRRTADGSWRRAVDVFNPDVQLARRPAQEER